MKQIEPFGATFHMGQEVQAVEKQADGRFYVETSKGTQFLTKTIFIAAGVGAFVPRRLALAESLAASVRGNADLINAQLAAPATPTT